MTVRSNTVAVLAFVVVACGPPRDSSSLEDLDLSNSKKVEPVDAGAEEEPEEEDAPPPADAGAKPVACTSSFEKDVLPAFDMAGCAATQCHGTRFGRAIRIEVKNPDITYTELTGFKLGGKPYVQPGTIDPNASAIQCHLAGKCGVKMPPLGGKVPAALVVAVDGWLACGAPKN
ncbi:MAG: hypothetical protein KIT84_43305 [Labilithrix sp.]|nr:hypothetical protein [Labilithrix sp.]MCW5817906.1 hypothetical protein [Labilithrix sp.]